MSLAPRHENYLKSVVTRSLAITCRYLCMNQAAVLPSLTDSTVVWATPPKSPPQNAHGSLICMVSVDTSGRPHLLNLIGDRAVLTRY